MLKFQAKQITSPVIKPLQNGFFAWVSRTSRNSCKFPGEDVAGFLLFGVGCNVNKMIACQAIAANGLFYLNGEFSSYQQLNKNNQRVVHLATPEFGCQGV
jgi:hypothetical protein